MTFTYYALVCVYVCDDPLPTTAPLVMHTQHMNGLRRSFLCRVKKSIDQHQAPQVRI